MRCLFAIVASAALCVTLPTAALAHGGGLNAEGCHNDRKNGGYHCHRAPTPRPAPKPVTATGGAVHFANCAAARAAGAAPVRRGQPGYGAHLDRDNDGVGCE
jgi:hypothetical protein